MTAESKTPEGYSVFAAEWNAFEKGRPVSLREWGLLWPDEKEVYVLKERATNPMNGLYYASVGGAPVEIVRIHDRQMFSIGCADGHPLEGVELVDRIDPAHFPLTTKQEAAQARAWAKANAGVRRGYRSFQ